MSCPTQFSFLTLYAALKLKLTQVTSLHTNCYNTNQVKLTNRTNNDFPPKFSGERDVLIRIGQVYPSEGFVQGAGRLHYEILRLVEVIPRTGFKAGMTDRDDAAILDTTKGQIASEEFILDALCVSELFDTGGNRILAEPMRLHNDQKSEFKNGGTIDTKNDINNPPSLYQCLVFEVKYAPLLSL